MNARLTVLERHPLTLPNPVESTVDPMTADLGQRAAQILGYNVLNKEINRVESKVADDNKPVTLAQTLAELEIEPYTDISVKEYKNNHLRREIGLLAVYPLLHRIAEILGKPLTFASGLAWITLWCLRDGQPALFQPHSLAWQFLPASILLLSSAIWIWARVTRYKLEHWRWESIPLFCYELPVPAYVLEKAIAIKERLPNVDIKIEQVKMFSWKYELIDRFVSFFDPDPFLSVEYGSQKYYIEVWDEPKFEAKL